MPTLELTEVEADAVRSALARHAKRRIAMPTLELTEVEADAVRSALARMWHSVLAAKHQGNAVPCDDYNEVIKACDRVVEKLNKAEGRG